MHEASTFVYVDGKNPITPNIFRKPPELLSYPQYVSAH